MKVIFFAPAVLALYVMFAAVHALEAQSDKGGVRIKALDSNQLEATYHSPDSGGVHISSRVNERAHRIHIQSIAGDNLLSIHRHDDTATLLTIMGQQFLILNESDSHLTGYAVPYRFTRRLTQMFQKEKFDSKLIRFLEFDKANESRSVAVQGLLERAEVNMIHEAAAMLGEQGVTGETSSAIHSFYILAMRLANFQTDQSDWNGIKPANRERRAHCSDTKTHCRNNGWCCTRCPGDDNCLGMCGSGCTCWPWVCGTCCHHQTCYDHDRCCRRNPNSWGCLLPFGFSCRRNGYRCYSDNTFSLRG